MEGYTVGSVASFISGNKELSSKTQSKKKKKLISGENECMSNSMFCGTDKLNDKSTLRKRQKNNSLKNEVESVLEENDCMPNSMFCGTDKLNKSALRKRQKNISLKNEVELMTKKRKSIGTLKDEVELIPKKGKISTEDVHSLITHDDLLDEVPDLDNQPSDSSEDETTFGNSRMHNKKRGKKSIDDTENTIFVGNLPTNYDKQKVCKVFSKFGKIQSARIRCVPIADFNISKKVAAVKKKFNPQRNSLAAYVKYVSSDSVKAAVEANGLVIDGHHLRIDSAEENKQRDNNKAVFVGGLSFNIEDDELWEFFEKCGKINSVRIIRDSHTSMGKGFGYVNFDSTASVELALKLDGQELKKRNINVKRCVGKKMKIKNKPNPSFGEKSKRTPKQLSLNNNKGKELKVEKKEKKLENKTLSSDFQGRKANVKQKKKKKLSKEALHKKKIIKILGKS